MISAIVLNWNGKRFLKECFASLLNQTFNDCELIMVDNGSTDGSLEFMRDNFPQVKLLALGENIGFCRAMNAGMKLAKGDLIALFNNDVVVDENWMAHMHSALKDDPHTGICASKVLFYKERNIINSAGDIFNTSGEAHNRGFGQENDGRYDEQEFVFSATAAACIYRRTMLDEVGLFDEDFFNTYEDMDLGFRAHLKGWSCLYVPGAIVYHHWLGTIGYFSLMNIFYMSKNNLNILVKNMPLKLIIKYAPVMFRNHLGISLNLAANGSYLPFIKGRLRYLLELPRMLRKRNIILKNKRITTTEVEGLLGKA
jgi:GT2 family glycosyltransferase